MHVGGAAEWRSGVAQWSGAVELSTMSEDRLPERATENEDHLNGKAVGSAVQNSVAPGDSIVQSASLFLLARRILLTSLGAIALTFEETNDFIERLIERGEVAEHELSALVADVSNRGKEMLPRLPELPTMARQDDAAAPDGLFLDNADGVSLPDQRNGVGASPVKVGALGERVEGILGRLNVPSRGDIETLTRKIDLLSGKVLLLKGRGSREAGTRDEGQEIPVAATERNAETTETT